MKSKKKQPFKRRESLNKRGWHNDSSQKRIDEFLVPKRKKKGSDKFMMMGCSDSYSHMPSADGIATNVTPAGIRYRSKRRINKLIGKKAKDGPLTRSRLSSIDFKTEDNYSDFREIKRTKRNKLNLLKTTDEFPLMFA